MIAVVIVISYLIGTFPSAYFLVKKQKGIDISGSGSGNIGAMNTYDVTGSKSLAVIVMIIDALKGIVACVLAALLTSNDSLSVLSAGAASVLGHNFNIFLKMKGGRGLATAAGTSLAVNPVILILWALLWLAGYKMIKKDVHVANVVACLFLPFLIYYTPELLTGKLNIAVNISRIELIMYSILLSVLILIKHIKPLIDLYKKTKADNSN